MNFSTMRHNILLLAFVLLDSAHSLCDTTCTVCLTNLDFADGTYRITEAGKYCLDEDIEFNPKPGSIEQPNSLFDWFPSDETLYPGSSTFFDGAYALGFFAAIAIESNDVEIDLCGQSIGQHLHHYMQQRFFSVIEIANSPFLKGVGPTHFGPIANTTNIHIHNGNIGLSSHHGIHSNEANHVLLEDLTITDFEVGGIQMNGFSNVVIRNVVIGPSAVNVQPAGYYSNAKFLSLAYKKMLDAMGTDTASTQTVNFAGGRTLSVQQVYDNLITSMDIAFRHFIGESTAADLAHNLYDSSIELFSNKPSQAIRFNGRNRGNILNQVGTERLPDGSALYGIVMHSRNLAVFGYGQFENFAGDGENAVLENVQINDLRLKTNEIPAAYFDECDGNDQFRTIVKGPFADVLDLRHMVGLDNFAVIDSGDFEAIQQLSYIGNPLSDAQIALALHGPAFDAAFNTNGQGEDSHFLRWALDGFAAGNYDTLPDCAKFMCNGDIMLHTNKGIVATRFDLIENVTISGLDIDGLTNESPLSSFACLNYTGSHDGGNPNQLELEGTMSTDVKGIAMIGSDAIFEGETNLRQLVSNNGDAVGMHLMQDSVVVFDEETASLSIERLISGATVTNGILAELQELNKTPYPNNFFVCNVLLEDDALVDPEIPNGLNQILCIDGISAAANNN